jgi:signal peptide peptidase SppA
MRAHQFRVLTALAPGSVAPVVAAPPPAAGADGARGATVPLAVGQGGPSLVQLEGARVLDGFTQDGMAAVEAGALERLLRTAAALAYQPQPLAQVELVEHEGFLLDFETTRGVAILPIIGIVQRQPVGMYTERVLGITSQDRIRARLRMADERSDVHAIALKIASPGGLVSGMFDVAEAIADVATRKPLIAVVDDLAASAAYLYAAAAREIVIARHGRAGSIGVLMMHVDQSGADQQQGLTFTLLPSKHARLKTLGNPHEPLSDEARQAMQETADAAEAEFIAALARYRRPQGLTPAAIRALEGGMLRGKDAVAGKLADRVDTLEATIARLAAMKGKASQTNPRPRSPSASATRGQTMATRIATHNPPLYDDGAFDSAAAVAELRRWATVASATGAESIDFARYARGFAVCDGPADQVASYKYPHHRVRNGELVTSLMGVRAAIAGALAAPEGEARAHALEHLTVARKAVERYARETGRDAAALFGDAELAALLDEQPHSAELPDEAAVAAAAAELPRSAAIVLGEATRPLPPPPATPAAPASLTQAQLAARATGIRQLCAISHRPELIEGLLAATLGEGDQARLITVDEARELLALEQAKADAALGISGLIGLEQQGQGGKAGATAAPISSTEAIRIRRERAQQALAQSGGR